MTRFGAEISSTDISIPTILGDVGPPDSGTHAVDETYLDDEGQIWMCTAAGTPGSWVAVGSGRAIGGPTFLTTNYTMTTAATEEDVTGFTVTFTYDGRPVRVVCFCPYVSHDQAAQKSVTIKLARSTDSAIQCQSIAASPAANIGVLAIADTGPITAWPSDSAAFAVGTAYTLKARITAGASTKGSILGSTGSRAHLTAYSC